MKLFSFLNRSFKPSQLSLGRPLFASSGGTFVTPDSAMQVSAFYSGVIYISTQVAKLPYKIKDKNKKEVRDKIYQLIDRNPNPEMNAFRFWLFMVQCAVVRGNGYAEIERDITGRPRNLWPIKPDRVIPVRLNNGDLAYRVIGGGVGNQDVYLRKEDMFHLPSFHTEDGIMGQGVIGYASEVLGISLGADRFANSLYANGGMPSGIISIDGVLNSEAAERLKKQWDSNHSGRKVGGTAVLEQGAKYSPITYSPEVMQFLESRKFSVLEIARFLRIPPTKLYDPQTSTYNNIEHANLEVAVDTLDAWAINIESEVDSKLLNNNYGDRTCEVDIYSVFRGDMATRATYFTKMMQVSAITPNEIREKEGYPGYEGGDRYYLATNNYSPVDRIDEIIDKDVKKEESSVDQEILNILKKRSSKRD